MLRNSALTLLFFLSGTAALIYEVLWLKELGLLFGNTSQAMAATLTAFFLGLALGAKFWGQRAGQFNSSLKSYAGLELGIAFFALGYFVLLKIYTWIYPILFECCGQSAALFLGLKFILAILILTPPAFFMGGTLPVITSVIASDFGFKSHVAFLYGINTLGAVVGVLLAGFYLPPLIGYRWCYALAMLISVGVGLIALALSKHRHFNQPGSAKTHSLHEVLHFSTFTQFAFLSGFLLLGLHVLWGRMFSQVLQNSVYTFSIVLMVFLFCLALGGFIARQLLKSRFDPGFSLLSALLAGGLWVSATPFVFMMWTDQLRYISSDFGWGGYVWRVAELALVVMGPPVLIVGIVFPLLMGMAGGEKQSSQLIGRLVSSNTVGAIAGSLLAGFVMLDLMGLWASIRFFAVVYLLMGLYWYQRLKIEHHFVQLFTLAAIALTVSVFDTAKLPVVSVDPINEDESLMAYWESSAGTVAVVKQGEQLKLKVNNHYTLGGTASMPLEQFLGYMPLYLHEHPRDIYMLGLGTGISAGGTLNYPIHSLIVTELLSGVIQAADSFFGPYTQNLFYDPRVQILNEDGRHFLRATSKKFDVIISDLFVPWEAGTGSLYAVEHYQAVAGRLDDNGLFMQWLPAYQLSRTDFEVIARTLQVVFPQVTVWRADFSALRPVIGLLGHKTSQSLSSSAQLFQHDKEHLLHYYVGDLSSIKNDLSKLAINSDDHPLIEFAAPIRQRLIKSGKEHWLVGVELIDVMQKLNNGQDAYLSQIPEHLKSYPRAGLHRHSAEVFKYEGRLNAAQDEMIKYESLTGRGD
ncbi:fused MFS/spermidine synthase [Methylicorpusculum sp.]|uniref:fused MFS/spermidine synthase n=1 Tax=Methylicorpusculum sp. TaxID=2713644 RepID=UPI0027345003|nr:fused MFS/spermidine synthase [Methylicorpusculum sp.]MDP3529257.1 fused MFS/spermidine synthase [Methylicorpusculum sp.]MDZ4149495.1 fused MFS/spermidine synthase [Methylicorpusculum sp.]